MFICEFYKISKNAFFTEHLWETASVYRVCIITRPNEVWQRSTNLWIKKNHILRGYCLLPEKQMWSDCSFMNTFEKIFLPIRMQKHGSIIWVKFNWAWFDIYTRFYLSKSLSQILQSWNLFFITAMFTEIWRWSSWKRCTLKELLWFCWWNNRSYLKTCFKWKGGIVPQNLVFLCNGVPKIFSHNVGQIWTILPRNFQQPVVNKKSTRT